MSGLLVRIWAWIESWFVRRPQPLRTVYLEELPESPDPKAVYVLGEGEQHWFVSLLCPCGCGAMLQMSRMPRDKPHWRLSVHDEKTISIHPSTNGSERVWGFVRSHYLSNRVFKDYDELFDSVAKAWNSLDPERLKTLTRVEWIERAA